jgi:hypothetical protein
LNQPDGPFPLPLTVTFSVMYVHIGFSSRGQDDYR